MKFDEFEKRSYDFEERAVSVAISRLVGMSMGARGKGLPIR